MSSVPSAASAERRSTVTAPDGVRLAVREEGPADGPVVVLVHGYPDTSALWDRVVRRLVLDHRVVRYDVRGAGESDRPAGLAAYDLRVLSDDLMAVLDATAPGRSVHLVGHDWGAIQSWESAALARTAPRLRSFTAIAGPSLDLAAGWMRRSRSDGGAGRARALRQLASSWYIGAFHLPLVAPATLRVIAPWWGAIVRRLEGTDVPPDHPAPTFRRDAQVGIRLYRRNFTRRLGRPRYSRVLVPVVQVLITLHDPFITPAVYEGLDRAVDDLRVHRLDCGHWAPLTHPDLVAGHVTALVAELEPSTRA